MTAMDDSLYAGKCPDCAEAPLEIGVSTAAKHSRVQKVAQPLRTLSNMEILDT